jgi:hypothetical protein
MLEQTAMVSVAGTKYPTQFFPAFHRLFGMRFTVMVWPIT